MASLGSSRFRLLGDKLAQGGYGEVWAAWDQEEEKLVAIKRQRPNVDGGRELHAFMALPAHPSLVEFYGAFVTPGKGQGGALSLVFRYHNSSLFHAWSAARRFLDFGDARRYSRDMFAGLDHLHSHNVCHRDLVMPNMLLSFGDGRLKIADLGLAGCAASFTLERNVTQRPGRAPEVLFSHADGDGRAGVSVLTASAGAVDLWSAGTVCAALFFARNLFNQTDEKVQLQTMVDFLGPPAGPWPAVASLRRWGGLSKELEMRELTTDPAAKLTTPKWARRPLPAGHAAIDLVLALIAWDPDTRLPARAAFLHPAIASGPQQERGATPTGETGQFECGVTPVASESAGGADQTPGDKAACCCKGSCGRKDCSKMKSKKFRGEAVQVCSNRRADLGGPGKYCAACQCAVAGCTYLRFGKFLSPFCPSHRNAIDPGTSYVLAGRVRPFGAGWARELKATAANAEWIAELPEPCDLAAFGAAFEEEVTAGDGRLSNDAMLRLWAAAYMKWPEAVEAWRAAIAAEFSEDRGVSARSAAAWAQASARVAAAVNGKTMPDMHSAISRGSAASSMGAQIWLRRLGVCTSAGAKRKRDGEPDVVHVGKGQTALRVDPAGGAAMWKAVLDMTPFPTFAMPQTPEELARVIHSLDAWLRRFPSALQQGGARDSYIRKHIVRKFVLYLTKRAPRGAMRAMQWGELAPANADKKKLTAALPSDATWGEIEDQFGMHPLMVAAWCCSLAGVPDKFWQHFEDPSARVREVALAMQRERSFPPNARELAERLG